MSAARSHITLAVLMLLSGPATAQQIVNLQPESGRSCAICHLSWMDAFKQPEAVVLIDQPPDSIVSEGETCLGCHDGSVADSRRRVWVEHGHRTGVAPPPDMKVPEQLPLTDGRLACRTCHTAHAGGGAETLASIVFLRMRNDASQLCMACHPDKAKGPGLGTHPVGGMPFPVPPELIAAGARMGPDRSRLICQTCHTPHGSREHDLLVMGTESSQLCLTCHRKLRPAMWRPDTGREHPQNPPLSGAAQREAIKEMGTRTGPGQTLICLSCHKLHHGLSERNMLADSLTDSHLCLRCHPGRASMFGTQHDLRVTAPEERNRLGQTPQESGPCGACHSFHQFARRPEPTKIDPTGLCVTCHLAGRVAQKATGLPFSHPSDIHQNDIPETAKLLLYPQPDNPAVKSLACLTCHNPHETTQRHFLRAAPDGICANCHGPKLATLPPAHDFTTRPEVKNGQGDTAAEVGKCGFCHGVHNALGPALWVATPQPPQRFDGLCLQCHRPGGLAGDQLPPELRHPAGPGTTGGVHGQGFPAATRTAGAGPRLPLFDEHGHRTAKGFVTCASCHDPHGAAGPAFAKPASAGEGRSDQPLTRDGRRGDSLLDAGRSSRAKDPMLRLAEAPEGRGLCAQCHQEARAAAYGLHGERFLAAKFGDARYCAPCHVPHARPGMPTTGMWGAPLGPPGDAEVLPECMGCHGPGGKAPTITPTAHPAVALQNVGAPGTPGYLPLTEPPGAETGVITCTTCHLPHGRTPASQPVQLSPAQLRNERPMLRPYQAPNLCATCHGFDGMRRFLYYHHPARRGGSLDEGRP